MAISGRVPLLLLLGLVPVVLRPAASTVWLWLAAVALVVVADVLLAPRPVRLQVERRPVGAVRIGEPAESQVRLANDGTRRVRALVRDAWQPTAGASANRHRVSLGPGEATVLRTPLLPRRRGDLRALGVTVRAHGPLRLAARQATLDAPGHVRSLPAFPSRRHLPSRLARLRELDGRAAVRVRGQGTEFDSLREYVRGDDVRSIDWRASARNRNVVVRTWQPERDRRVVLVLDTSRTSAGRVADVPRLDSAMDATLLLAALAARAGDRVDFVAGDRRVRARLRSAGSRDVAARLQDVMADLEPVIVEADWGALAGAVTALGRQRALLVLLTPLEPAAVEEGLLPVLPTLTRHHRVVVASVRDPALEELAGRRTSVDDVYGAAAAEQALRRRRATADLLGALGVEVIDADAERLPPALADHYLSLKARGLL
ncbi:DUF58 domain-containing protein [Nocardioides lianchengensis]|uniref:Uncharacterized conserved protein, DUF58 family, contains vWF domain n=1 Tax=Nocardioides lianchengensis TaxID=1045774 RepID=A0A1G6ICN9_9ACTN|nr:DUF58 domain-containing protein [Nocardioides lianchengensis]NYG13110.1 uncharacterized protein (DUF58 family) [Nocardioides lianchengensis]SDC03516.1 Uncharacterized conserved protein, DUF58 family, contains vWF domain [Nocardioides lianchengensis]